MPLLQTCQQSHLSVSLLTGWLAVPFVGTHSIVVGSSRTISSSSVSCASGPIPTGEQPKSVTQASADPRFPADKFIAAVGTTTVGAKPAGDLLATVDAAARASLAAAVSSTISSEVKSLESVDVVNGKSDERLSAEQRVRQLVEGFDLTSAITIEGRWREGDTAHAWAVLDKAKALSLQQGKIADRAKLAQNLVAQGDAAVATAPADALRAYARARVEADGALNGLLLLRALGGKAGPSATGPEAQGKLAVLGVEAAKLPAWAEPASKPLASAIALKKGVGTTRVLVLLSEKIEGGNPVMEPPVAASVTTALQNAGFDAQSSKAFVERVHGEEAASLTVAQLEEQARGLADVVVVGKVTSRYSSNFGGTTVWHRARADVRAIDVGTGQIVFQSNADEVKSKRPGELNVAGRSALEALGEALGPNLEKVLRASVTQ